MAAPVAALGVGLMALTRRRSSGVGRLLSLQNCLSPTEGRP